MELAEQRYQSLRKELDQLLLTNQMVTHGDASDAAIPYVQLVLYENNHAHFISARRRTVAARSSSESRSYVLLL